MGPELRPQVCSRLDTQLERMVTCCVYTCQVHLTPSRLCKQSGNLAHQLFTERSLKLLGNTGVLHYAE